MQQLTEHPTVQRFYRRATSLMEAPAARQLDANWLRQLCCEQGADDVGFLDIDHPEIADQRADILAAFPQTKTLVSFVCRMSHENIRSPARSVANLEFHHTGEHVNEVARRIVALLSRQGVRALNPAMGFPMEMDRFPGKVWVVSHKPIAVAAGLGHIGIHRNVIHPQFGSFILLGTILLDTEVTAYNQPLDYNPCLECKLCVAACPTGAIGADGAFNFSACYTHNYREFMGGFSDWVETIAGSASAQQYRQRVGSAETVSMWQSLSFGPNYKAAYCLAVCPAGDDVIGPFLAHRQQFLTDIVDPLQQKVETVYVVAGSDAEAHVARRFPHKRVKHVRNGIRLVSIQGFLRGLPLTFQRGQSAGLDAVYHFTFTGEESCQATVIIRDNTLTVHDGCVGTADLHITADSKTWLDFLTQERHLIRALMTRKVRIKGPLRLLKAFGRCFPS